MNSIPVARLEYLPSAYRQSRSRAGVHEPTDVAIAVWLLGPPTQNSFPSWAFKICMEGAYPLSVFCEERPRKLLDTRSLPAGKPLLKNVVNIPVVILPTSLNKT